jgi:hypothetical protein
MSLFTDGPHSLMLNIMEQQTKHILEATSAETTKVRIMLFITVVIVIVS